MERRRQPNKRRRRIRMFRAASFCLVWMFAWQFFTGAEISIIYNKEKAMKARRTFWQTALSVARYVGDFKRAIF